MKKLTNNIGLKIVALLAAILLWYVIINVDDPLNTKVYSGIEVSITNESIVTNAGQIYQVTDGTSQVSVTVTAARSILSKIKKEDIVAVADFANLQLDSMLPITVTIPSFEGRYSDAVANPKNIQIQIENLDSATYPVSVVTTGSPQSGYFVQSTEVYPDTLTVTGPESKISKIESIQVIADVSGMSQTGVIDAQVRFFDEGKLEVDSSLLTLDVGEGTVQVTAVVSPVKKVDVEASCTGVVREGYEVTEITYDPTTVSIIGKDEDMEAVSVITIPGSVLDVTDATDDVSVVVNLNEYLPEGVSLADGQSEKLLVKAHIEKYGTKTLDYPVGSIAIENIPEGFEVSYGDVTQIGLVFTGSAKALASLSISNVDVWIDLDEYTREGTYNVEIEVETDIGCVPESIETIQVTLKK